MFVPVALRKKKGKNKTRKANNSNPNSNNNSVLTEKYRNINNNKVYSLDIKDISFFRLL